MKTFSKFVAVSAFLLVSMPAFSQQTKTTPPESKNETGRNTPGQFTDKDGNGICDHFEKRAEGRKGAGYTDHDKDGVCDYYEQFHGKAKGPGFVDRNGDGICDHRQDSDRGGKGYGRGYRHQGAQCCGRGHGYGRR